MLASSAPVIGPLVEAAGGLAWWPALCLAVGFAVLALKVGGLLVAVLGELYKRFLRPAKDLRQYGAWAVVTGATDGIGRAYAFELARKGLNVLLLSRTEEKLQAMHTELAAAYPVEVDHFAVDFSRGAPIYPGIAAILKGKEVGILVNNVGCSYDFCNFFSEITDELVDRMIHLNVEACAKMTKLVLPGMEERGAGAVVTVGSFSGTFPAALLSLYSASKAFTDVFSKAMAIECRKKGVFFQSVMPLFVATKLSKQRPSFFTPSPEAYARQAVATIGHDEYTAGFLGHTLQSSIVHALPVAVRDALITSMHLTIRGKGLRKLARKAK